MSETLALTKALIQCPSITPNDAGCQKLIATELQALGFHVEHMRFHDVDNLWARWGTESPLVVLAGHTDVVPTGPLEEWTHPPFEPVEKNGLLYGRGATDMKSGVAAMLIAAKHFLQKNKEFKGSIGFLITSDEEGPSIHGTQKVIEALTQRDEKIDYCIIGEASSEKIVGDQIRVGRRGSFHGKLIVHGKQGHVAFPEKASNPIHHCAPALADLAQERWDEGNEFFPPTTFQISNIHAGTGALNVIPGDLEICFNFRFSTAITIKELQDRVMAILSKHQLNFNLNWNLSAHPFLSKKDKLIQAAQEAVQEIQHISTKLSTGGGTSDGRFIAPTGAEVIELGPVNTSAHHIDEYTNIAELEKLMKLYERILEKLLISYA